MNVENLVIEARVKGTDASTTIGEHSEEELFLEGEATLNPVIYQGLKGEGWRDAFRRRLAPHLARIVERPDYADVFALFLLDDTDVQREATLLERGITQADVDAISTALGIVSEGEKRAYRRWFGAILALIRDEDATVDVAEETIPEALESAGLRADEASRLIDRGGGDQARRDVEPDGALAQLWDRGIDLRALDEMLKAAGDDGLHIRVARLATPGVDDTTRPGRRDCARGAYPAGGRKGDGRQLASARVARLRTRSPTRRVARPCGRIVAGCRIRATGRGARRRAGPGADAARGCGSTGGARTSNGGPI